MLDYKTLQMGAFEQQIQSDPNAVVLDVRTPEEYASGHLEMAINAPNVALIIPSLDRNKHYYIHCRVGGRSAMAAYLLAQRGFEHVSYLDDSIQNTSLSIIKEDLQSC